MKVHLVVTTSGSSTPPWDRPVGEALVGLGAPRQVMPHAWVVRTPACERDVLERLRSSCGDDLDVVVVRLDLGGYAAHLRAGGPLSSWWGDLVVGGR